MSVVQTKSTILTQKTGGGANIPKLSGKAKQIIEKYAGECSFDVGKQNKAEICTPAEIIKTVANAIANVPTGTTIDNAINILKKETNCETESCVIRSSKVKKVLGDRVDQIIDKYFKPAGPSDNFGLLSNFNIDNVLSQFSKKHTDFLHLPFQMRDFQEVGNNPVSNINLGEKLNGKFKKFGVVFNTDYSTGRGIHWFCVYGEVSDNHASIEYFNSSGQPPLEEIMRWMNKQAHYIKMHLKVKCDIVYVANIPLQQDNHSCGVWCLTYIWFRLEGVPHSWFKPENINDRAMHALRAHLFIKE